MSLTTRKIIPLAITLIIGVYMILEYFIVLPAAIQPLGGILTQWGVIVIAYSLGVGAVVTITSHAKKISRKEPGQWPYSLVLIGAFILFLSVGLIYTTLHPAWDYLYKSIMLPLYATTYSMWVFYMASGAYRALRAKNFESSILLFSGSIVMLGNVPIGEMIWSGFPLMRDWIISVPNMAANRGILIGAALGAIVLGLRVLVGKETGYLGTMERGE